MSVSQGIASSPTIKRMAAGRMIRTIGYWFFTILIAWEMALGAYWDLFQISYVREVFTHLHLPSYFLIIMGIWKLPCAVILLMPRAVRMKEWAYAGVTFALTHAAAAGAGPWGEMLKFHWEASVVVAGFALLCQFLSVLCRNRWVAWLFATMFLGVIWVIPAIARGKVGDRSKTR